ncbi:hypothetical protein NCCP1664_08450 [Zafaria cholistanensis]|uniref:CopC domain-containing protein n=1 Tax=Zafaria cholistanensis TaxID=1682741 RepID=A0A5A7NRA6_9MICC|nr:copper resistance CopC family protein [Zafaria cholistanensis]GER22348.1 hypothetical protein NCCP1664_08450 [Zafaria cholistanensis]
MNPQHSTARPGWRRFGATLATAAAIGGAALACAPAASAHDSVVDSTPEDGAELATSPTEATLRYSADLNKLGTVAQLKDAQGQQFGADPSVSGDTLTVDFGDPLPDGDYTLTVRVVSSDGHPVDGTLEFSVEIPGSSASPASPAAASAPSSSPAALGTPQPTAESPEDAIVEAAAPGGLPPAAVWGIAAAAVLAAGAVVLAKVRRQTK